MERTITDHAEWEQANGEFLAASLDWLRLLLTTGLDQPPSHRPVQPQPQPAAPPSRLALALRASQARPADPTVPPSTAATPDPVAAAAEAVSRAEAIVPIPALASLAATFGLSRFERDTLLLCAAPEIDPSFAALFARAQGNTAATYPTFALALAALPDPAWSVVAPPQALRYWQLIDIAASPGVALTSSPLRAEERIINIIKGLNYLDDRFEPLTTRIEADLDRQLPPSQQAVADEISTIWQGQGTLTPVLQLAGPEQDSKRLVAAHAAAHNGLLTYRMPISMLPADSATVDELARLWQREAMLLPVALYVDTEDTDEAAGPAAQAVRHFVDRVRAPIFLAVRESWPDLGSQSVLLDVTAPTSAERAATWASVLPAAAESGLAGALATQFPMDLAAIRLIAQQQPPADDANPQAIATTLWNSCRSRTRPRLDALARRLEPRVGWDDLVVPAEQLAMLHQIADQVAHRSTVYENWGFSERITRGLGVSALFAGPSGVGKTMGAEVLANDLKLDLYRIDLSAVVSKYIGETEKNLRRLFDAAESGGVILFFDEADALFGKRSDIKDAHDRYANVQTNYLLQRMEEYSGLSILATTMRRSLDGAFMRRLRFIVEFRFPELAERRAIWAKVIPDRAPRAELDLDRLAELRVTGGMVRNIALNAAFLASAAGTDITMPALLQAARTEFRKLELPIREQDFR